MAVAPLQLPGPFQSPSVDLAGSLSQLGQIYKKAQNDQKLSDLGKGLASGTIDYRTAAGQVADMGDVTHTLQFLALAEQQKKQADELAASEKFTTGLSGLYGANPTPAASAPNPSPVVGSSPPVPAVAPGAPVPSSPRVVGDAEGVSSGLYDPPAAPGQRPPVQTADATPAAPPAASVPGGLPPAITPRAMALIGAAGSPRLPQAQRELAKTLLTSELDGSKATSEMKEWAFAKSQDPNTPDYTTWARANKAAGKTEVNVDTKGANAFATAGNTAIAKRFEKLTEEGDTASTDLAMVGQLRDLRAVIGGTGGAAAAQKWLADHGIKVGDNVGAVEAYGAIVDKLTPQQRVPGSGATSDYEGKQFKASLPNLMKTDAGNEIVENTLAGLAQTKVERAKIAEQALSGEIKPGEALKKLRELPNPYENFKNFAKTGFKADPNNPASAVAPKDTGAKIVPSTKVEIDQSLANARAAVAKNPAIRDAVIQRLRENGIDPSGL